MRPSRCLDCGLGDYRLDGLRILAARSAVVFVGLVYTTIGFYTAVLDPPTPYGRRQLSREDSGDNLGKVGHSVI
jgi:hypothetical protein